MFAKMCIAPHRSSSLTDSTRTPSTGKASSRSSNRVSENGEIDDLEFSCATPGGTPATPATPGGTPATPNLRDRMQGLPDCIPETQSRSIPEQEQLPVLLPKVGTGQQLPGVKSLWTYQGDK